ncbi:MAG: hypothetical protein IKG93_05085 [Clostridiales bacterium]|nr:hypothetical protein [Clostridiales bacterium]
MRSENKKTLIIVVVMVVLAAVLAVFYIRDTKKSVIKRKTNFEVPSYCDIVDYYAYGSIFKRTGFEAKIKIDTVDHMNEVIGTAHELYGDDFHEISVYDFAIQKYSLFSGQKLIPNPTVVSWVIVGKVGSGSVVMFVDVEENNIPYAYLYYAE